ncbi:HEAT repeat domain-containing protein [Leptodesmis sichuanensis]|uniref:HEAT repeat domain-containing protein n=1 Tax=Leptodesmis sichuanensis TaxID=2906798 RepID=UPI001F2880F7|nr:HEAT repeat domain-containing protein [Leptodesmis sichuanensis]UIE38109.1 HEAT repeat domain-containing protein [Leptodesmis sichuanensis A121]
MARPTNLKLLKAIAVAMLSILLSLLLHKPGWTHISTQTLNNSDFEFDLNQLTDTNTDNDEAARKALLQMGAVIIDPLILKLESPNVQVRRVAASLLREFGPTATKAIPPLINRLKNDTDGEVRWLVASSLGRIGPAANNALPGLIQALKNDKVQDVRVEAAQAIGMIAPTNPETLQALSESLKQDADIDVQKMAAAMLVEKVDLSSRQVRQTLNDLKSTLKDSNWQVQLVGAMVLAANGRDVKEALSTLNALLQSKNLKTRQQTIEVLFYIARQLRFKAEKLSLPTKIDAEEGIYSSIAALKILKHDLEASGIGGGQDMNEINQLIDLLDGTIQVIKPPNLLLKTLIELTEKNPYVSGFAIYIISLLALWSILLGLRPLWLWQISEMLSSVEKVPLPLPQWAQLPKPIHNSTLIVFFHYHPRVLDAWVAANLPKVCDEFAQKRTVKERAVHIPIPVVLNGKDIPQLTNQHLREAFTRKLCNILIWGEGGSGKTSLACELARWAMSNDPDQRLCKHRMIPILLEQELDFEVTPDKQVLREAIRGQLRDLLNAPKPVSEEFLEQLLRQQRLLVIVDHFSEMSEATRKQIRPERPDFPINALIVTSRVEEKLGGVNRTTLKPMRIAGNYLSEFMGSYLTCQGKRELFTDEEFFEACSRLSAIAGNREITVLLAKLYAEQIIAVKVGIATNDIPDSIPGLMLQYLNQLNQSVTENRLNNRTVHQETKIIAWECLKPTYQPTPAKRDVVIAALDHKDAESHLDYFENRLRIIQTTGVSQDHIRFALDPLAEYLAGLHLVEVYGNNKQAWQSCLTKLDAQKGKASIQGFLLALKDCCLSNPEKIRLPDFLVQELQQRISQA